MAKVTPDDYRSKALEEYGERCKICESVRNVRVHHIDGNRENNALGNLLVVCSQCHAEIHSPGRSGNPYDRYKNHLPQSKIYGESNGKGDLVTRSVAIREDQKEWVNETDLNLSAFVRRKIDERRRE